MSKNLIPIEEVTDETNPKIEEMYWMDIAGNKITPLMKMSK